MNCYGFFVISLCRVLVFWIWLNFIEDINRWLCSWRDNPLDLVNDERIEHFWIIIIIITALDSNYFIYFQMNIALVEIQIDIKNLFICFYWHNYYLRCNCKSLFYPNLLIIYLWYSCEQIYNLHWVDYKNVACVEVFHSKNFIKTKYFLYF